jgi:hypothetical protein
LRFTTFLVAAGAGNTWANTGFNNKTRNFNAEGRRKRGEHGGRKYGKNESKT